MIRNSRHTIMGRASQRLLATNEHPDSPLLAQRLLQALLFCILLAAVSGCGSDSSDEMNSSGSVSFALQFEPLPSGNSLAKTSFTAAVAPPGFDCAANSIGIVHINVIDDASKTVLVSTDFNCDAHEGRVEGIPMGGNRHLEVDALPVSGAPILYQGFSQPFMLSSGESTDVGLIQVSAVELHPTVPLKLNVSNTILSIGQTASVSVAFQDINGATLLGSTPTSLFSFGFSKIGIAKVAGSTLSALTEGTTSMKATFGSGDHQISSDQANLTVQKQSTTFDFTLNLTPTSQTLSQGDSVSYTVTATLSLGFPQDIALSISDCAGGANCSALNPSSVRPNPTSQSVVTVTAPNNLAPGGKSLTITGNGGGVTRSTSVPLIIATTTGTVLGTIIDTFNRPVPFATVMVLGTNQSSIANVTGNFTLSGVPAGTQTLIVSSPVTSTKTVPVTVVSGRILTTGIIVVETVLQ